MRNVVLNETIISTLPLPIKKDDDVRQEIELRFGFFDSENKFVSDVGSRLYSRLAQALKKYQQSTSRTRDSFSNSKQFPNVRRTLDLESESEQWIEKTKRRPINLLEFNMRLAVSQEKNIAQVIGWDEVSFRIKERTSFAMPPFRVDLTKVTSDTGKVTFEVEIEFIGSTMSEFKEINKVIYRVWTGLYGGLFIFTQKEKLDLINAFNRRLGLKTRYDDRGFALLRHGFIVHPRNIKMRDLVDGGTDG